MMQLGMRFLVSTSGELVKLVEVYCNAWVTIICIMPVTWGYPHCKSGEPSYEHSRREGG